MSIKLDINSELKALVSLLDEPNEDNFISVRSKISAYGIEAIALLEEASSTSSDHDFIERSTDIISEIYFDLTFKALNSWSDNEGVDLMKAFLSISKMLNHDIDTAKYLADFEKIRRDVWLELNDNLTALEKIRVLNHVIYDYHEFEGQRTPNGDKLKLYYLDHLLDNKRGNALSLGILYLAIAQNLNLPIYGVDLPGHFVLCYLDEKINLKPVNEYNTDEVLFYLNALNKGAVFTVNEVNGFVNQMNLKPEKKYISPCSNKTIIKRLLQEVSQEVKLKGDENKSMMLLNLVGAVH